MKPPADAARSRRNVAIALALVAFAAVVFAVTMIRMAQNTRAGIEQRAAEASVG